MIDLERELRRLLDGAAPPKPFAEIRLRAGKIRRRRTAWRATAAAAAAVVVLVVATIVATRPHNSPGPRVAATPTAPLAIGPPATFRGFGLEGMILAYGSIWVSPPGRVVRLDPADGHVVASITVRGSSDFRNLAAGAGSVWVDDTGTQTLNRIDPVTNRVIFTVAIPGRFVIDGLQFANDKLWIARLEPTGAHGEILVFDAATNRVVEHISGPRTFGMIAGTRALWYTGGADNNSDLVRVDTTTHAVSVTRHDVKAVLAAGDGKLWLLTEVGVIETDEATGAQIGSPFAINVSLPDSRAVNPTVTIAGGAVWIAAQPDSATPGTVTPYDIVTHHALHAPIPVGFPIVTMTTTESAVWVLADVVTRIPFRR